MRPVISQNDNAIGKRIRKIKKKNDDNYKYPSGVKDGLSPEKTFINYDLLNDKTRSMWKSLYDKKTTA